MSFLALVRPWLDELDGIGWLNFQGHRMTSLCRIRDVTIRLELLHAAVRFWDPKVHVFRFGFHELCPTVEEFHAYLGGFSLETSVIPLHGVNFADVLSVKLGISNKAAKSMLQGGTINILRIIAQFRPEGFALCLCLLVVFLFVRSDGQASSSLVGVAMQIEERKDVALMVLAETLMGLDRVYAGDTNVFEGSALLLQVNLLEPVPRRRIHETQGFIQRDFLKVFDDVHGWFRVLSRLTKEVIAWRLSWLDDSAMAVSNMGRQRVILASLSCWNFYIPNRILRQLRVHQIIPSPENFVMPNHNFATFRAYQNTWRERVTIPREQYPSENLSKRYVRWLIRDMETREHGSQC